MGGFHVCGSPNKVIFGGDFVDAPTARELQDFRFELLAATQGKKRVLASLAGEELKWKRALSLGSPCWDRAHCLTQMRSVRRFRLTLRSSK